MGIKLQNQERFGSHYPLKVMEHKAVRCAGEVADPGDKYVWIVLHIEGGVHILLAIVPVHIREYLLVADRQDVERNYCVATACELPGNTNVGLFCKCVVWPSQKGNDRLFLTLGIFQSFFAQLERCLLILILFLERHIKG